VDINILALGGIQILRFFNFAGFLQRSSGKDLRCSAEDRLKGDGQHEAGSLRDGRQRLVRDDSAFINGGIAVSLSSVGANAKLSESDLLRTRHGSPALAATRANPWACVCERKPAPRLKRSEDRVQDSEPLSLNPREVSGTRAMPSSCS